MAKKQDFIHTRLSRAYLALARLSCNLGYVMSVASSPEWADFNTVTLRSTTVIP